MPSPARIAVRCAVCAAEFTARAADVRRGHAKYCGRAGNGEATRRRLLAEAALRGPNTTCAQCGECFHRAPSKRERVTHRLSFYSRACKDVAQSLAGHFPSIRPSHYGSAAAAARPEHYRKIAFSRLPARCNRCGWAEHAAVLVVHHRNRDRNDDRPDDLEVLCPRCHEIEHFVHGDGRWTRRTVAASTLPDVLSRLD